MGSPLIKARLFTSILLVVKSAPGWLFRVIRFQISASRFVWRSRKSFRTLDQILVPTGDQVGTFPILVVLGLLCLRTRRVDLHVRLVNSEPGLCRRWLRRYSKVLSIWYRVRLAPEVEANVRHTMLERYAHLYTWCAVPIPPRMTRSKPQRETGNGPLVVSLLGRPLLSKGSADLAKFLSSSKLSPGSIQLRLQGGAMVLRPLEEARFDMSQVVDLGENLSRAELDDELLLADVLLMPYRSEIYYATGSAMFYEAMDAGVPVAVRSGIGIEREVIAHGLGLVFDCPNTLQHGLSRVSLDLGTGAIQGRIEAYNVTRIKTAQNWTEVNFESH